MENLGTPKLRRMHTEIDLKRSCSSARMDLDDLIFKSPSIDMTPKRKRKRHRTDDDCVSLQSVDISLEEPKKRRRSSLAKMSSLTSLLSPIKPVKKVGHALQKSLSLRNLMSPSPNKYHVNMYKKPQPTPPKRRASTLWYETVNADTKQRFNHQQIDRQEAIFELYRCEEDLIEDLEMVKTTYHDSMSKLKLMTEEELRQIFGPITTLVPIHEELVEGLRDQRQPDGYTDSIGEVLLKWVPRLKEYIHYCSNQVYAKALLDVKKQDPAVDDFLQRCQDSPFSRRLDLWSFLDVPRSRLVKYPLLFKAIQKKTSPGHPDVALIEKTVNVVEEIIAEVDRQTGSAKCELTRSKLEYLDEKQKSSLIDESDVILCDGMLKNNRGTKLYVFLFEKIMVLTRAATRGQQLRYQVYRQPIPVSDLVLDDLQEGGSKSGSFRSAFTQANAARNMFKVCLKGGGKGHTHTLQATDEHDKRQWIQRLREVLPKENIAEVHSDDEGKENSKQSTTNNKESCGKEAIAKKEKESSHKEKELYRKEREPSRKEKDSNRKEKDPSTSK